MSSAGLYPSSPARDFSTPLAAATAHGGAQVRALSDEALVVALASDGGLIKRPFLQVGEGRFLTGFKLQEWQELLEGPRPASDP